MTKRRTLLIAAAITPAALLGLAAGRGDDTGLVKKNANDFKAAWNKHDSRALAAFWAKDGDLICPEGKLEADPAAIEKFFAEQFAPAGPMAKSTFDLKKNTVRFISPDVALEDWEVILTGMTQSDGSECGPMMNRVVIISKKEGGNWKYAAARPGIPQPEGEKGMDKPKTPK